MLSRRALIMGSSALITSSLLLSRKSRAWTHGTSGGGGGYVGPLDIVPGAVVAYGQRALSSAKRGTALYSITRDSDDTTQPFNSDGTTGGAPIASINAFIGTPFTQVGNVSNMSNDVVLVAVTGVSEGQYVVGADVNNIVIGLTGNTITLHDTPTGTNPTEVLTFTPKGYVLPWKDQSSSGVDLDTANAVEYYRLSWKVIGASNRPGSGAAFPGQNVFLQTSGFIPWINATPGTIFCVCYVDPTDVNVPLVTLVDPVTSAYFALAVGHNVIDFEMQDAASNFQEWDSPVFPTDFSGLHIFEAAVDASGNVTVLVNGVDIGVVSEGGPNVPLPTLSGNLSIKPPTVNTTSGGHSYIYETLLYPAVSIPNRLAIRQNMATYYGITLP